MNTINLIDLQQSINMIFNQILLAGLSKIELKEQYYWMISPSKKYDMSDAPTDIVIGDLTHDFSIMENAISSASEAFPYHLVQLAPLLVYVAEEAARRLPLETDD